jgi:A/G-specific adenine glycosylase
MRNVGNARAPIRSLPVAQRRLFTRSLLAWYRSHRRELPWRASRDPYRIWVAEVMLQQTRIAAVIPYYERFLVRFPTAGSLARGRPQDVLKAWAGLGYYSRARNLHRAAKKIMELHDGEFPREIDEALALPGVGSYTAAAVLSIAYDLPLSVLDGNVARVLARIHAVRDDLRHPPRWKSLHETAGRLLDRQSPADWNQALMELGETICAPQNPRCAICPVARSCRAIALHCADQIPAPRRKRAPVKVHIAAAILCDPLGRTLLVKDPGAHDAALFSRMWQFPAVEVAKDGAKELEGHLRATLGIDVPLLSSLPAVRHGVTFRKITLLPFVASVPRLPKRPRTRIFPLRRVRGLAVSSATRKIAAAFLADAACAG